MAKKPETSIVSRLTPECGVMGTLMIFGCAADVWFTYDKDWGPWDFGGVFALIMTGGKGIKILDSVFGRKK